MFRNISFIVAGVLFFFGCGVVGIKTVKAASCTASVSGNWSASSTWGGACNSGSYPGVSAAGDTVTINTGVTVTLDISPAATIGSITVNAAGATNGITWSGTQSLEVTGATSIAAATATVNSTLAVGTGTFKADGSVTITGSNTSGRNSILSVSTGVITFGSGLTFSGTAGQAQFTTTGVATINLTGTLGTGGTLSIAAGTNLTTSGASFITYAAAITTWGAITVNSNTLTLSGASETSTSITVANGATLSTSQTITDSGAGANALVCGNGGSATISGTGVIVLSGASAQMSSTGTCTVSDTGAFTIAGATAPQIASGSIYSFVSLTISGPVTNNGTITITTTLAGASTLTNSGTGTLNIKAASVTLTTLTATASGNIVNYNLNGTQTCKATAYYNLNIFGGGTKTCAPTSVAGNVNVGSSTDAAATTWSVGGTVTITGNLSVTGNATYNAAANWGGAYTVTVSGNLLMSYGQLVGTAATRVLTVTSGTFSVPASSTASIGEVTVTIGGATTIDGALSFITNLTGAQAFNGNFTVDSGGSVTFSVAKVVTFSGNITNNGTWSGITGAVTMNTTGETISGSATTTVASMVCSSTVSNAGILTITGVLSGTGTMTNSATGILTLGGTPTVTTLTVNAAGNQVIYTGGTMKLSSGHYYDLMIAGAVTFITTETVGDQLNIITGGNFTMGSGTFTVTATTSVSGTLTLSNASGIKTFNGNVVVNNGATWTESAAAIPTFAGNLTNNGTFTASTGVHTFSGTGTSINGTLAIPSVTVSGTITNNNTTTISTTLAGSGTLTNGSGASLSIGATSVTPTLVATASGNTVNYNGTGQTCRNTQYYNLTFGGTSTITCNSFTSPILGNLIVTGTAAWAPTATVVVAGSTTVAGGTLSPGAAFTASSTLTVAGGTVTTAGFAFIASSTVSITSGLLNLVNNTGAKTFVGNVAVSGGSFIGSSSNIIVRGGITQSSSGVVNATGTVTFAGNQTLTGTISITTATLTSGTTLTNNGALANTTFTVPSGSTTTNAGTITMSGALTVGGVFTNNGTLTDSGTTANYLAVAGTYDNNATTTYSGSTANVVMSGAGTFINDVNANFNYAGGSPSITTLAATAAGNTVNYNGGAVTCAPTQYYNLTFGGSGTVTCAPTNDILGNLTIASGVSWTLGQALIVDGSFMNGGTFDVNTGNWGLTLKGNFTNSGTFTARNGTTTFAGVTGTQIATGTMTGSSAFWNLAITNSSGTVPADCGITNFSPSVLFGAGATANGTYGISTGSKGNVDVQYNNGSAYSFHNVSWVGPPGTFIYFRSSAPANQWGLSVSGTQSLAYVNVSDSNAAGSPAAINAAQVTNRNCGDNNNWTFATSTSAVLYTQAAYQWFANQTPFSGQVSSTLAAMNASATLASTGGTFRLRMLLAADATNSIAGVDSFMLQYAPKGLYASCNAVPSGAYAPITSATPIAYYTNANVTNGTALVASSSDPTDSGRTVGEQTYQSANNFSPIYNILAGQDGDWDFSLYDNNAHEGTDYCLDAVFSSSSPIYAWNMYPEIATFGVPPPRITNQLLANGSSTIILSPGTTTPVTIVASTTAGGNPIAFATSTIYRTSEGSNCAADNRNCYQIPSSGCVFSNSSTTVTCTANMWYFADSTTDPSSSYPGDSWTGAVTVGDALNDTTFVTSSPVAMGIMAAIAVTPTTINYGILAPPQTSPTNITTTVQNAGNCTTTIKLSAITTLSGGIPVTALPTSSQQYGTSANFAYGTGYALSSTPTVLSGFTLSTPVSTTSVQSNIFWGLQIATGSPTGTYIGSTIFSALHL